MANICYKYTCSADSRATIYSHLLNKGDQND